MRAVGEGHGPLQEKPGGHPISITLAHITLDQIIVWLVIGAIAGTLVGAVVKRSRKGFGGAANLGIGLMGALIGGLLFRVFGLDLGLGRISVSLEDIVAAFAGSIVFLVILRFFKNR